MRRNLLIAQTLASCHLRPAVLIIAGAREVSDFALPPGVDCLTLPALHKEIDGRYRSRSLEIPLDAVISLRSMVIRSAVEAFQPDVLVVDNVPRGAMRELDLTLDYVRRGGNGRCVLGLRDVLDEPASVCQQWRQAANEEVIRDHYDAVWVYGDPSVYDLAQEYSLSPDVAKRLRYTGYLDQRLRLNPEQLADARLLDGLNLPSGRLMVCLVGGGQDGARLAEAFVQADLPRGANGVLVAGPFMPPEVRRRLHLHAETNPRLRVLDFVAEPTLLLSRADRVIAMGGYNTTCEILSFGKRALVVPRVSPRCEQLIRAERLRDLGLLDVLHPDNIHPRALAEWLARDLGPLPRVREMIDLNGLGRLPYLLEEVLAASSHVTRSIYLATGGQYVAR